MLVLGLDTATRVASVGLLSDGEIIAEESSLSDANHTEILLPLILRVLNNARCVLPDVQGVGVSIGPGSFTGLRIALGTIKGFAYALNQKVAAIPTLEALARTVVDWAGEICTVSDARKGEVYAAFFRRDPNGQVTRLSPDRVETPERFFAQLQSPCLFLGDGVERYGELIQHLCGPSAQLLPFSSFHPRGGIIAQMAWERFGRGEHDDIGALVPFYVRKPDAEFKRTG
jgi:tRNA threonylcarbamoyladenosine biosynthesis protein TsaB